MSFVTAKKAEITEAEIPGPEILIELLNRLGDAYRSGNIQHAGATEKEILTLVPQGKYEGYLRDDPKAEPVHCYVWPTRRRNEGGRDANTQSFIVLVQEFDGSIPVGSQQRMDLHDFLTPIIRPKGLGGCRVPRFWSSES